MIDLKQQLASDIEKYQKHKTCHEGKRKKYTRFARYTQYIALTGGLVSLIH